MKNRGIALIVVLFLTTFLLVLALGLLQRRADQYKAANSQAEALHAYELAQAGLESARVRLDKDQAFPPRGEHQKQFSCTEPVYDVDNATVVGYYQLEIDSRWAEAPYYVMKVTSTGCWPHPDRPEARRKLHVQLDLDPAHATTYYRWTQWTDDGTL